MTLEDIVYTLTSYAIENKQNIRKRDFKDIQGVPSYNTCWRKGLNLAQLNREISEKLYKIDPKKCTKCDSDISYKSRSNEYCSRSCSSQRKKKTTRCKNCLWCGATIKANSKYCSLKCFHSHRSYVCLEKWLKGEIQGYSGKCKNTKKFVRKYIFETRGTACSLCSWDERHPDDGLPLTQIDHIDGNVENTFPDNLRVLCPNCHSMTPTFLSRNKNSSRVRM